MNIVNDLLTKIVGILDILISKMVENVNQRHTLIETEEEKEIKLAQSQVQISI